MKFKKGDWVHSVRVGSKGQFVGEVVDISEGEYVVRDGERKRWLRAEGELSPAKKESKAA
ncbi:hypothetical protein J4G48_0040455 [Bradyrhizobium barranii subsp. apii]|uniref:hypothetical protein n=1 Tax=Bradyrhizobium barranii TaxID=2992140 RepID=UPI001AA0F54F|nr:hypothetical protein [Bradyrhizobium barranii]UPT95429.1 hypothetical protein J4G48_0040455 [Bradyrhizobium barranii subsp. apii]